MRLSRDDILKAEDLATEECDCPEWGGTVLVKALTGSERDSYEASCMSERPALDATGKPIRGQMQTVRNLANIRAKLVARCVVDDDGKRLFSDTDAGALGEKSAAALDRVFEVAARLSRLNEDDIEELGKGSAPVPPDGSASS